MRIIRLGTPDERLAADAHRRFGGEGNAAPSTFLSRAETALFVAMVEDDLVGWVYGHELVHPGGERTMLLYALDVLERARGQGIGTELVRAFVGHAEDRRCTEVWVLTEEDNRAAIATYRSAAGAKDSARSVMFSWQLGADPKVSPPGTSVRMWR